MTTTGAPAEPITKPTWWRRPLDTPPGRWFSACLVPPTLLVLWSATLPGGSLLLWLIGVVALFWLAVVWVIRVLVFLIRRRRLSAWLAVAPLAGLAVLGLISIDAPLKARWILAEPSFARAAEDITASSEPADAWEDQHIGTYRIDGVNVVGNGVTFWLAPDWVGLFCWHGFAYAPDAVSRAELPADSGRGVRNSVVELGDGWYAWTRID